MSVLPEKWLHYGDLAVARLRRSASGSYMPITPWLQYAGRCNYSGDTVPVIDSTSGEILSAEIFAATLGASKYAYAEATWTQTLPDWIASNIRMLEFFGSVPSLWIPDNLKAAIKKACRYEPEATSTYEDCARHYGAAISPARPYHARDKASVEMSVLVVQR